MKCDDCGFENKAGALICTNCGADLYDILLDRVTTRQLERTQIRNLRLEEPPSSNPLLFYMASAKAPIPVQRLSELIIGRTDPQTGEEVDVDLTEYDGEEQGVSRKHAILNAREMLPIIRDLGSYNGSFLNGQKLVPEQGYQIESGDELRLGRLTIRVYYK